MANANDITARDVGIVGTISGMLSAFFLSMTAFWLRSYGWTAVNMKDTQFGWMTFFIGIGSLTGICALICFAYVGFTLIRSNVMKIALSAWGVLMTIAVAWLVAKSFGLSI